jgi:YtkA-like protein
MSGRTTCLLVALVALLGAAVGCGADVVPPGPPPSFGANPDQMLTSDSGALRIAVRFAPDPPAVGSNAVELSFTDANGASLSGLGLSVVPWMPAHGHGTSVDPIVTEMIPGTFLATSVYLFMPGSWELRMTTSGSVDDTAKAAFEIP